MAVDLTLGENEPPRAASRPRVSERKPMPKPTEKSAASAVAPQASGGAPAPTAAVEETTYEEAAGGGSGSELQRYVGSLVQRLNEAKRYPRAAILREEEGRVVIGMRINPDGSLADVHIDVPSPFESLNRAALDTMRGVGKLPPPPTVNHTALRLRIPLNFELRDR
jgi:protein TonB